MTIATPQKTGAEEVTWDLTDLYQSLNAPELETDIADVTSLADVFSKKYHGKVAALTAEELLEAIEDYEVILEITDKFSIYASLLWATDTLDDERGRFLSNMQRASNDIHQKLLFFELEWKQASDDVAAVADHPLLEPYHHYLNVSRISAPFTLSEAEEKVISELSISGIRGWVRYFGEAQSNARYELDGELLTQSQVLAHQYSADRDLRRRAAEAMSEGLEKHLHTTTFVFNMVGTYQRSIDKMRGYDHWLQSRNLQNQVDDETVEALIDAVTGRYDIVARYYYLTRQLLGYDKLYHYDRYAPILEETTDIEWLDAQAMILTAYAAFDQQMADIAGEFFEKNWIDAALAPNKRGGAFSHPAVPSAHPYILMNYTGDQRSVMILAHELGHGVHQSLARGQGLLNANTPLTTSEMASTFGEMLVFEDFLDTLDDPKARLALRIDKLGDTFATVFRQITLNRFEDAFHTGIRAQGKLSTDELSDIWQTTQQAMFQDSLIIDEGYRLWWSYIPHFLQSPGYVYAYAFGELLVWTLYAVYKREGGDFAKLYLDALAAGGSMYPHDLLAPLGVDLQDPNFWKQGLDLIEEMVAEAEQEAQNL
ncbi:MAG: M3 family oligoendopeptidase [Chloroflexi bacterium]|nr:M3 family oligoendopeptidase [Chloroflexota bacterium]